MPQPIDQFVRELDEIDGLRKRLAIDAFAALRESDPELTKLATTVFGQTDKAAAWFARKVSALGNEMPLRLVAEGERELVIDCLHRIEHGMFA